MKAVSRASFQSDSSNDLSSCDILTLPMYQKFPEHEEKRKVALSKLSGRPCDRAYAKPCYRTGSNLEIRNTQTVIHLPSREGVARVKWIRVSFRKTAEEPVNREWENNGMLFSMLRKMTLSRCRLVLSIT